LSSIGQSVPQVFTEAPATVVEAFTTYPHVLDSGNTSNDFISTTSFSPEHTDLAGIFDDDAHPQYLLRSGGVDFPITGDVYMDEDVKIGGIIPSKHAHTGSDGSTKISGSDIDYNSITDGNIDNTNASTATPSELMLLSQTVSILPPGVTKIQARVSYNVLTTNVVSYEFEVTPLPILASDVPAYQSPGQILVGQAVMFKDFRTAPTVPADWEDIDLPGNPLNPSLYVPAANGLDILDNDADVVMPMSATLDPTDFTLVWHISRDASWELSTLAAADEGFELFAGHDTDAYPSAKTYSAFNVSGNVIEQGSVYATVRENTAGNYSYASQTKKLFDFGTFYNGITNSIFMMSFIANGVVLRSFGVVDGQFQQSYDTIYLPTSSQLFNKLILRTYRSVASITPVLRLHAIGAWDMSFTTQQASDLAQYLLS
ncbi:MAG TPA: hypothetical protein VJ508_13205, partial [Saprospiraceae bacterium]|nr:hypothetical protein [Saprospiraceae bacterium]